MHLTGALITICFCLRHEKKIVATLLFAKKNYAKARDFIFIAVFTSPTVRLMNKVPHFLNKFQAELLRNEKICCTHKNTGKFSRTTLSWHFFCGGAEKCFYFLVDRTSSQRNLSHSCWYRIESTALHVSQWCFKLVEMAESSFKISRICFWLSRLFSNDL